jgi:alkanesulfonate monooxygenase SsuD/methylene tetrahydromethanopterin reductase-like flavin-dependent oxidoreductase (luciferase family)
VAGSDLPGADSRRRLTTTTADLELSAERARAASDAAGRPKHAVMMSVLVGWMEFCRASEIPAVAERICRQEGLPSRSLEDCPYALLGEPAQMVEKLVERRERFGLEMVIIAGSIDPRRFCEDVLPHVS